MGDMADAILEGIFCESCGELLIEEGEPPLGFPQKCDGCKEEDKMTTKKERLYQSIEKHGEGLKSLFGLPSSVDSIKLCKKLKRLENEAHRLSTDWCNGDIDSDQWEKQTDKIRNKVIAILDFENADLTLKFNGDARGYALKIEFDPIDVRSHEIHRDWGGYGILAPDFKGE